MNSTEAPCLSEADWRIVMKSIEGVISRITQRYAYGHAAYDLAHEEYLRDWFLRQAPGSSQGYMYDHLARLYKEHGLSRMESYTYQSLRNRARDFRRSRLGQHQLESIELEDSRHQEAEGSSVQQEAWVSPEGWEGNEHDRNRRKLQHYLDLFSAECRPAERTILHLLIEYKLEDQKTFSNLSAYLKSKNTEAFAHLSDAALNSKASRIWTRFVRFCNNL